MRRKRSGPISIPNQKTLDRLKKPPRYAEYLPCVDKIRTRQLEKTRKDNDILKLVWDGDEDYISLRDAEDVQAEVHEFRRDDGVLYIEFSVSYDDLTEHHEEYTLSIFGEAIYFRNGDHYYLDNEQSWYSTETWSDEPLWDDYIL